MDEGRAGFPWEERLHARRDFLRAYDHGDKLSTPSFVLYVVENGRPCHRLGLAVSRKLGGAVVRNRIRRRLREVFRTSKTLISPPCDLVVNARRAAAAAVSRQLATDFERAATALKDRRATLGRRPATGADRVC